MVDVVMRRLAFAAGRAGQMAMAQHISEPIPFEDAPGPVRELFQNEAMKVTRVIVVHRDLNTTVDPADGYVWIWDRMEESA